MTSLPVVPTKFYQVCRLCLTVVSDTNDLMQLSVFGGLNHNAGCTNTTSAQTINNANEENTNCSGSVVVSASTDSSGNGGVIVKTIRKNEAQIPSSPTNEHHNQHSANNDSVTNNNDNEAAAGGTTHTVGDDDNNNFKIDGDLQHHSDILERIYTFLSITVSGSSFCCYPILLSKCFFSLILFYIYISFNSFALANKRSVRNESDSSLLFFIVMIIASVAYSA